ncbi:MAG: cbb3-type cytochrome c oxidase subunit 3 [SAR324 cluster bacterium]
MTSLLNGPPSWGATLGIGVLMAVFIAALLWMFRPGAKAEYRHGAELPLDDGTKGAPARRAPRKNARRRKTI